MTQLRVACSLRLYIPMAQGCHAVCNVLFEQGAQCDVTFLLLLWSCVDW